MEGIFSTNKYNTPTVLEGKEELTILIIRLLLLEPGSNPLHPEMGVGVIQRYSKCEHEDLPDLELEIRKQILVYLPMYQHAEVKVLLEDTILKLSVIIDDTLFNFTTSDDPASDEISLAGLK